MVMTSSCRPITGIMTERPYLRPVAVNTLTIENTLFNMTGSERMKASCANDNKDIIMTQLI